MFDPHFTPNSGKIIKHIFLDMPRPTHGQTHKHTRKSNFTGPSVFSRGPKSKNTPAIIVPLGNAFELAPEESDMQATEERGAQGITLP